MRRAFSRIIFFVLILPLILFSAQKLKEKDLPEKYRDWLKLVNYISLPQEKNVFMQLTSDRDRDVFIETFWKQRDPTPGTPQNEYKEEHIKRFNHASVEFKRGSSREGWMTDMGMFYILLGPPVSIERFDMMQLIYPAQVWYYYGDKEKGLPPHFALVFFRRGGAGEYRLYDPIVDGPASLLVEGREMDSTDYEGLYEKIEEMAPTLAIVSLSMIPGDIPWGYQPSVENAIIIADIIQLPKKTVSSAYATHFLSYKGIVSTEYMTNFIQSKASCSLMKDPILGINFIHFSVAPESISIDYYEPDDRYFCNFAIDVSLRAGEKIIFQYSKDFPFYFSPAELDNIRNNGIAIEDSFPVIEGTYSLTVLLRNSVAKEFSIFEKNIGIPEESEFPPIIGPLLGYRFETYDINRHIPFKVLSQKLLVDPRNTFSSTDTIAVFYSLANVTRNLWEGGKTELLFKRSQETSPSVKTFTQKLKDSLFNRIMSFNQTLEAKELSPDYYDVVVSLFDEKGNKVDESAAHFILSAEQAVAHPITRAKSISHDNLYAFYYMMADQYEKVKQVEKAEASYEKAYELRPDFKKGAARYAHFLATVKKFDKVLALAENLKDDESLKFDYYLLRGLALLGKGEYAKALESLLEGNKIYNSDTRLLNALGTCYYKTGNREEALRALKASLSLNPVQEDIKALIKQIEKGR